MHAHEQQLMLEFASIDFAARSVVTVTEIAAKLGKSVRHIIDHIEAGKLRALNTTLASKASYTVAVSEYRRWVMAMLTSDERLKLVAELPPATRREIALALVAHLSATERAELRAFLTPAA